MKTSKKTSLTLLFLVLVVIGVFWQFFIKGKTPAPLDMLVGAYWPWLDYKWGNIVGVAIRNPGISDVFSLLMPWKYLVVDLFTKGTLPLWNPYAFSGSPLAANYASSAFFPFNLILALPKNVGWGLYIFLQTAVGAAGMYLFLRKLVKSEIAAVGGGVVFIFSGLMTTWAEFGMGVWAAVFLPWAFYFLSLYFEKNRYHFLTAVVLSISLLILAGHTQITLYGSALFSFYVLYSYLNKKITLRQGIFAASALFFTYGIVAIQLVPTIFQATQSVRASEDFLNNFISRFGLTPWSDFIRLYAADFFGNPVTRNFWSSSSYFENSFFLGTLTLPFIFPLLFKRFRSGESGFWLIVFLVSLFMGLDNPVMRFVFSRNWPLITYSSASRIFFLTSFSGAVLASFGVEIFLKNREIRKFVIFSVGLLAATLVGALVYLRLGGTSSANFIVSLRNSIVPLMLLVVGFVILISKLPVKFAAYLLVIIIFFDLARFFLKFNTFSDPSLNFPETPALSFLQKQPGLFRIARLNRRALPPDTWIPYKLESIEGYDALASINYLRFFNRVNGNPYLSRVSRYAEIYKPDLKFLDLLNVKYLISVENESEELSPRLDKKGLAEVFRDKSVVIYENKNVLPRAFFATEVLSVADMRELAKVIDDKDFNPTSSVIVMSKDPLNISNPSQGDFVKVENYNTNSMRIRANTAKDNFLVVSAGFDPGWKATIDGIPTKIYEVDSALRGLIVPAGTHEIKMSYLPNSFVWGVNISMSSLVIIIGFGLYCVKKRIW